MWQHAIWYLQIASWGTMMFLSELSERFYFLFCGMSQYSKQMKRLHKLSIIYIFDQYSYCSIIPPFCYIKSMPKPSHQPTKCGKCLKIMLKKKLTKKLLAISSWLTVLEIKRLSSNFRIFSLLRVSCLTVHNLHNLKDIEIWV